MIPITKMILGTLKCFLIPKIEGFKDSFWKNEDKNSYNTKFDDFIATLENVFIERNMNV